MLFLICSRSHRQQLHGCVRSRMFSLKVHGGRFGTSYVRYKAEMVDLELKLFFLSERLVHLQKKIIENKTLLFDNAFQQTELTNSSIHLSILYYSVLGRH